MRYSMGAARRTHVLQRRTVQANAASTHPHRRVPQLQLRQRAQQHQPAQPFVAEPRHSAQAQLLQLLQRPQRLHRLVGQAYGSSAATEPSAASGWTADSRPLGT